MTDNIIKFPGQTTVDLPADRILEAAKETSFDSLFIVGMTETGEFYLAATTADMGTMALLHRRMGTALDNYLEDIILG